MVANETLTVLQQHVKFFDSDGDGLISVYETYDGFYRLGFSFVLSALAGVFINLAFSFVTRPGWKVDPWLRIYIDNIANAVHGSDQEVYDNKGGFRKKQFEEIFTSYDKDNKGGLTLRELWQMTQGSADAYDLFGWLANKGEWIATWLLAADDQGVLRKQAIRDMYDGSLFYNMEKKQQLKRQQRKQSGRWYDRMSPNSTTFSALWAKLRGRPLAEEPLVTQTTEVQTTD